MDPEVEKLLRDLLAWWESERTRTACCLVSVWNHQEGSEVGGRTEELALWERVRRMLGQEAEIG